MTEKQKRFCEEYIVDCNATQAAIRAGYSEKTAYSIGQRLLKKVEVQDYIEELRQTVKNSRIADATEIQEKLMAILRGEDKEEKAYIDADGEQISYNVINQSNQLKSAELLAKMQGAFLNRVELDGIAQVVFSGEGDLSE